MKIGLCRQPWKVSSLFNNSGDIVHEVDGGKNVPLIKPAVFGRPDFPRANGPMPEVNERIRLQLRRVEKGCFFPNRVLLSIEDCGLSRYSFVRGRTFHHGGLIHNRADDTYNHRIIDNGVEPIKIDKPIYFADSDFPDIYGHFLLEILTQMWAIDQVDRRVKIGLSTKLKPYQYILLERLGVTSEQIVVIDRPVVSDIAYLPTNAVRLRNYVQPAASDIFERLGQLGDRSVAPVFDKIYVSRSRVSGRRLKNEREVEAIFANKGFLIFHPQEYSICDQIKIFREAKFIAGTGGSAMHNVVFSKPEAKVLILASEGWFVVIDVLLSQINGRLGYVFGLPERKAALGHRTQSDWSISLVDVSNAISEFFSD